MRVGIDVGGTFTDFVAVDGEGGGFVVGKRLTTPEDPSVGAIEGTLELAGRHGLPLGEIRHVLHGTTLVANTIIERRGARTGLIATEGFRDVLETGRDIRYDLYDLTIDRAAPLVPRRLRLEVTERLDKDGEALVPLRLGSVDRCWQAFKRAGVEAVAVSLMHSFRNSAHERAIRDRLARLAPDLPVSLSCEVAPEIREYDRTSTTVANAYVLPVVRGYLGRLETGLRARGIGGALFVMLSGGGIAAIPYAEAFPIHMVESGPAGGALAAAFLGRQAGLDRLLAFDMGGTTAKLCLTRGGEPTRALETEVARVHRFLRGSGLLLKVPVIEMIEIGAGGGSIARRDALGLLKVGPQSAGASPGPACYGLGATQATVTDADLLLGYLDAGSFLGGEMALDVERARAAIHAEVAGPLGVDLTRAAAGIFDVVTENMASAARVYLAERGADPRAHTLVAFGGAGPVHAFSLAQQLKIPRVLCPLGAGATSALGFLIAPPTVELSQSAMARLEATDWDGVNATFRHLEAEAAASLAVAGVPREVIRFERMADMRYAGQGYEITVSVPGGPYGKGSTGALEEAFAVRYGALFGQHLPRVAIEVLTWRLRAMGPAPAVSLRRGDAGPGSADAAFRGARPVYFADAGRFVEAAVFNRAQLGPGAEIQGPAVVEERESTAVIPPGARASVDAQANLVIELPR